MTRKDYIAVAATLRAFAGYNHTSPVGFVVASIADALANRLALDNPRFDRARFMEAACDEKWLAVLREAA